LVSFKPGKEEFGVDILKVREINRLVEIATSIDSEYIRGEAKLEDRLLIFLDLSKVFTQQEKMALSRI